MKYRVIAQTWGGTGTRCLISILLQVPLLNLSIINGKYWKDITGCVCESCLTKCILYAKESASESC